VIPTPRLHARLRFALSLLSAYYPRAGRLVAVLSVNMQLKSVLRLDSAATADTATGAALRAAASSGARCCCGDSLAASTRASTDHNLELPLGGRGLAENNNLPCSATEQLDVSPGHSAFFLKRISIQCIKPTPTTAEYAQKQRRIGKEGRERKGGETQERDFGLGMGG
jgi:hypothetical protein